MNTAELDKLINWINNNNIKININEIGRIGFYIGINESDMLGLKKSNIADFVINKFDEGLDVVAVIGDLREYIIK